MSTTKKTKTEAAKITDNVFEKLNAENIEKTARQIWLAGLGAYGRSSDEVKNLSSKLSDESQKLFDELVVRGEKLQTEIDEKIHDGKGEFESQMEKLKEFAPTTSTTEIKEQLERINKKLDAMKKK